ncbi:MAG TPA: hypothetical protein VLE69_02230 [Candidatus Saccharimonadales bacterium]|nr:hypothetical protein [Candidatus Saccharimonadales bacterium]
MGFIKKTEDSLEGVFKGLPPLPEGGKEGLTKAFPWIALVFGILQLLAGLSLWHLTRYVNVLNDYANSIYQVTGTRVGLSSTDKMIIYLGIIILIVDAVILLMAVSPLMKRARRGWDLLFLSALINLIYSIVSIFISGRGFGTFLLNLLTSAIGFYLLFQIRSKFKGAGTAPKAGAES